MTQTTERTVRPVITDTSQKSQGKIHVMKDVDSVPSNVQSSRQEALLYVFEDDEAVIEMIIKRRSPTMRHVSRTHRVALDWLFDRINLDSKIQIKYIDTKTQLADILTKGNFTRDEWNHLLCLFNISHFSSTICFAVMAKRSQQASGEERVTAKSRPMMNIIARTPSFVPSSTSVSPGNKHYGSQDPWKSVAGEDRSGRPGKETNSFEASDHHYHEQFVENWIVTAWSSQEWKAAAAMYDRSFRPDKTSWRMVRKVRPHHEEIFLDGTVQSVRYGETLRDRSGRHDNINSQEVARPQNFIMGSDTTELEMSVKSKSFVNRVNDQVRKRQKKNFQRCRRRIRTFFFLEVNVYGCNKGISDTHGEEFPRQSESDCEHDGSQTQTNVLHICNVRISTAYRFSVLKILRIVHTIYFILQFL